MATLSLCELWVDRKFPDTPTVSPTAVTLSEFDLLLDGRSTAEFAVSHLENARHVPFDGDATSLVACLHAQLAELRPPSSEAVRCLCYCSLGYRSALLADQINALVAQSELPARLQAINLRGGVFRWVTQGRSGLVDPRGSATQRVHPYNRVFGQALAWHRWQWTP